MTEMAILLNSLGLVIYELRWWTAFVTLVQTTQKIFEQLPKRKQKISWQCYTDLFNEEMQAMYEIG